MSKCAYFYPADRLKAIGEVLQYLIQISDDELISLDYCVNLFMYGLYPNNTNQKSIDESKQYYVYNKLYNEQFFQMINKQQVSAIHDAFLYILNKFTDFNIDKVKFLTYWKSRM